MFMFAFSPSPCTAFSKAFSVNRVFSLTWPAAMPIYWNKRKRLHKKRVHLPQDWFGTHQHGRRFIVMGHNMGRRDVMWKHSIGTKQVYTYRKSSIKPISSPFEGQGGLMETEGLFERGGGLFNLETTTVSVLHKELEYKVEKLKYKKFRSCSQGSESSPIFQLVKINRPGSVHTKFYSRGWLIQSIIY